MTCAFLDESRSALTDGRGAVGPQWRQRRRGAARPLLRMGLAGRFAQRTRRLTVASRRLDRVAVSCSCKRGALRLASKALPLRTDPRGGVSTGPACLRQLASGICDTAHAEDPGVSRARRFVLGFTA
jgi:hypothetical protein